MVLLAIILSCVDCAAPTTATHTQPAVRPVAFDIWQRGMDGQETSLVDLALFPGGDVLAAIEQGGQLRLLRLSPDGQVRASGSWPSRLLKRVAIAVGSERAAAIAIYSENAENAARDLGLLLGIPGPGAFLVRLDAALHPTSITAIPSLVSIDRLALHASGEAAVAGLHSWGQALVSRLDAQGTVSAEHVIYGHVTSYFSLNTLAYDAAGSLLLAGVSKHGTASLRQPASDHSPSAFVARFPASATTPWIAAFSSSCVIYDHPEYPSATQLSSGEIVLSLQPAIVGTTVPIPWMPEPRPAETTRLFLFLDGATGALRKRVAEPAHMRDQTVALSSLPDGTWLSLRQLSLDAHTLPWRCPPGIRNCHYPNGPHSFGATHSLGLEHRSKDGTVLSTHRIDSQAVLSAYRLWYSPSVQRPLLGFSMIGSLRLHNQLIESQQTHDNPCPTKPSAALDPAQRAPYSSIPPRDPCEVSLHLNQVALVTHL
ncbi:hypothetical protein [Polyangium mundeleinium]|uniref:Uncharacterized protein n=1 Tax=Polyangium mundeleinium TaxID=2995306 RepID=A0ABT5EVW1_9BACT|nr:hypothetical protein [Polyangium mundeleinium]MDC0744940.1 hypothetical protein [Polyangium mundeleinium]